MKQTPHHLDQGGDLRVVPEPNGHLRNPLNIILQQSLERKISSVDPAVRELLLISLQEYLQSSSKGPIGGESDRTILLDR